MRLRSLGLLGTLGILTTTQGCATPLFRLPAITEGQPVRIGIGGMPVCTFEPNTVEWQAVRAALDLVPDNNWTWTLISFVPTTTVDFEAGTVNILEDGTVIFNKSDASGQFMLMRGGALAGERIRDLAIHSAIEPVRDRQG